MDFHSLINAAKQNVSEKNQDSRYYKTKFDAPKKTTKEKKLSSGIRKFLEKQRQEEEEKARIAHEKKMELLARRDDKEKRKIEKTLKVIKSSKKFYTGDKELDENTEITLQNTIGDNDDYDFESKYSESLYEKLMEKYNKMPQDDKFGGFNGHNKKSSKSSSGQQNDGDEHHFKNGHRQRVSKIQDESPAPSKKSQSSSTVTKTTSSSSSSTSIQSSQQSSSNTPDKKAPVEKPKPKIRAAPPVNFEALMKLAEQKQHEDIVINVPSKKEPERLMTSKEKREIEELEAARKARFKGSSSTIPKIPKIGAIPKIGQDKNNNDKDKSAPSKASASSQPVSSTSKYPVNPTSSTKLRDALVKNSPPSSSKPIKIPEKSPQVPSKGNSSKTKEQPAPNSLKSREQSSLLSSKMLPPVKPISKPEKSISPLKREPSKSSKEVPQKLNRDIPPKDVQKTREFPPRDLQKSREFPPRDVQKTREFPPRDVQKTRDFPPRDLQRAREFPPRDLKRPSRPEMSNKRRIIDEDSESEYDSELDDFIDDSDANFNYSNEIQKIFGYDKSRYRDEDFDDREMESDYRTVMKEEFISKKIGLMEDLEDMRMEAEEKKRKEMKKKRRKM